MKRYKTILLGCLAVSPLFFKKTRQFDKIYFGCFSQLPVLWDMVRNYLKI